MSGKRTKILRKQFEEKNIFGIESRDRNKPEYKKLWRLFKKTYK